MRVIHRTWLSGMGICTVIDSSGDMLLLLHQLSPLYQALDCSGGHFSRNPLSRLCYCLPGCKGQWTRHSRECVFMYELDQIQLEERAKAHVISMEWIGHLGKLFSRLRIYANGCSLL